MRTSSLRITLLASALAALSLSGSAPAHAGSLVDITIINRVTGERLTPHRHEGKLYVAGRPGDRYAVELANRSGERLLTVVSVDGVNVLTGQTASGEQSGYVLDPWRHYGIYGWRKDLNEVAQFVFTSQSNSYAARTGRPGNVGVIGVAVFREQPRAPATAQPSRPQVEEDSRWEAREHKRADTASALRQSPAAPAPESLAKSASSGAGTSASLDDRRDLATESRARPRLGTGHGQREHSPTSWTQFVRASNHPEEVISIHYDSRANLIARGIIQVPRAAEPTPFPGGFGFVPDPRS